MQPEQSSGNGFDRRPIRLSLNDGAKHDGPNPPSALPQRSASSRDGGRTKSSVDAEPTGAPTSGWSNDSLSDGTAAQRAPVAEQATLQAEDDGPLTVDLDDTPPLRSFGGSEARAFDDLQQTVGQPFAMHVEPHAGAARVEVGEGAAYITPRHQLEQWLDVMVKREASDLILRSGGRPACRIDGRIVQLEGSVPHAGPMREVLEGILGPKRFAEYLDVGASDAALQLDGLGRFRINAYRQMGEPAIVLRRISDEPPVLEDLCLPTAQLQELALRKRGIMLVTGVAGSGKSTTLAGMIQYLNTTAERHVVTLEDPVEMLFKEKKCVISQREVGTDVANFSDGLRHALRQSPDVILIGEMRDAETVRAALDATETGHFVMSTLHTVNSAQTIERIVSFFPSHQHAQVRARLGDTLTAVLSQRLIPNATGEGMVPAIELMQATPYVRELIAEGRITELATAVDQGVEDGMISFNGSLLRLIESGLVEISAAMAASDKPDELMLALRGFQSRGRGGPQLRMGGR